MSELLRELSLLYRCIICMCKTSYAGLVFIAAVAEATMTAEVQY